MPYFEYLDQFLIIAMAHFFAVVSPGPDFFLILRQSFVYGKQKTILTSLGVATGILVHSLYCVLGLSYVLTDTFLHDVLRILCSLYLFYLGFNSIFFMNIIDTDNSIDVKEKLNSSISSFAAYRQGFITNLLNVKASLFFISLYSFIDLSTPKYVLFFYALWMTLVTGGWFIFLTILLSANKVNKIAYHYHYYISKLMGFILIYIAIKICLNYS
ncbi:MAG: lysine transporter LysE [Candidatus Marinimicrobia bacterium]|nr:lysine transporter LysE [Candidatus Neomarinimicrobiota bacterium]|tara:strand:- start:27174 stop:27815 length:642 start_codon:yes stop_codon:yes gene_type:complete